MMSTATEQIRSTKHEVPSARDTESVVASGEGSAQPAPRWLKPDRFSDGIVIMLVLTGLQRLVGFGRSVLLCLFLSPYELGHWDIAFGFLTLAAPIAVLSLPAAFGRYVEYYRQRGQLRTFLRRIAVATVILAVTAALAIAFGAERFSQWIFGAADHAGLVRLVAATLLANILYNVVAELFTALRMQRIASGMEFVQSLAFATLAVALVSTWESRATSIVLAYGGACLVALAMSSVWLWFSWREIPAAAQPAAQGAFWSKLIPFVAWVWVANWLANLFLYVDRYMVVHFSRMTNEAATALVGQYHSSRLVPQLLVTVAAVLSGVMIPFLSRDWEIGRTDRLSARMNLLIKLTGLGLTAAAALVLAASPLLFGVVFKGKFDAGLEVLPWTLIYSAWFGILCVARVYLWCAEKVRLVSIAYLAGLLVNIGMNLLLVPHLGLLGAVLGTCAAHFMALGMVYAISAANGLRLDRGIWLISLLPLTLLSGPWGALGATAMAIALSLGTNLLVTAGERRELISVGQRYYGKLARRAPQPVNAPPAPSAVE